MTTAIYLDLVAMVAPALSLWLLIHQKSSFIGLVRHNLGRFNIYFFLILLADIARVLTQSVVATDVMMLGYFLVAMNFGHAAAVIQYCPEAETWGESIRIIFKRTLLFPLYLLLLGAWLAVTVSFDPVISSITIFGGASDVVPSLPMWYTVFAASVGIPITLYPALLILKSWRRVQTSYKRNSLFLMLCCWLCFPTVGLFAFFQLSPFIPFSYELELIASTLIYCMLAISTRSVTGTTRFLRSSLSPQSFIRTGKRYLILHDASLRTISFLSSALRSAIDAGARVAIASPTWLIEGLSRNDSDFNDWQRSGKLLTSSLLQLHESSEKEGLSARLGLNPVATVFVKEFAQQDLLRTLNPISESLKTKEPEAEVLLLESRRAPRPQLAEFLEKNKDTELVDLSEASDPFSTMIGLNHRRIEGSKILLEYSSNMNAEDLVSKFFDEGIANAEMCALFTSKSSTLYRALKAKRMVRFIAASSLVSTPDELPDGEIQIPDKELGLVTSLVTEFYENNKSIALSLVFDSLGELIRGERWEQIYSGVKQLVELTTPSTITAIFLVNKDTTDSGYLGALRGLFSVQMRIDENNQSLRVIKSES